MIHEYEWNIRDEVWYHGPTPRVCVLLFVYVRNCLSLFLDLVWLLLDESWRLERDFMSFSHVPYSVVERSKPANFGASMCCSPPTRWSSRRLISCARSPGKVPHVFCDLSTVLCVCVWWLWWGGGRISSRGLAPRAGYRFRLLEQLSIRI